MNAKRFVQHLANGEIPPKPIDGLISGGYSCAVNSEYYIIRGEVVGLGMYALVDKKWTKDLADWIGERKCLEIQAGVGWLAKALSDHGVDIIATDNYSWSFTEKLQHVFKVRKAERRYAVATFDAEVLIISWPHFNDDSLTEICDLWGYDRPVIYIGEGYGGCCAPESFFERFKYIDPQPSFDMPSWDGIHDHVYIGYFHEKEDENESD